MHSLIEVTAYLTKRSSTYFQWMLIHLVDCSSVLTAPGATAPAAGAAFSATAPFNMFAAFAAPFLEE